LSLAQESVAGQLFDNLGLACFSNQVKQRAAHTNTLDKELTQVELSTIDRV